jgi:hypothetical protein
LRNVEHLLLDKGIARLFGALFALQRLGAVLVCLGCQIGPPSVRNMTKVTGEKSFRQIQSPRGTNAPLWLTAYFLTRAVFLRALAIGSSGDSTILAAGSSRVTLLSPRLWAS